MRLAHAVTVIISNKKESNLLFIAPAIRTHVTPPQLNRALINPKIIIIFKLRYSGMV